MTERRQQQHGECAHCWRPVANDIKLMWSVRPQVGASLVGTTMVNFISL